MTGGCGSSTTVTTSPRCYPRTTDVRAPTPTEPGLFLRRHRSRPAVGAGPRTARAVEQLLRTGYLASMKLQDLSRDGQRLRVAGLFAGVGGIELGLHQAGHTTSLLCEVDPGASRVLS